MKFTGGWYSPSSSEEPPRDNNYCYLNASLVFYNLRPAKVELLFNGCHASLFSTQKKIKHNNNQMCCFLDNIRSSLLIMHSPLCLEAFFDAQETKQTQITRSDHVGASDWTVEHTRWHLQATCRCFISLSCGHG